MELDSGIHIVMHSVLSFKNRCDTMVSDNHSDPSTHMTRGLVRGSDWLGRFGTRKGMTPSRSLKSSPP
jgi:hypothetical protein